MSHHKKAILLFILLLAGDLLTKYFFFDLQQGSSLLFIHPAFNTGISRSLQVPMIVTILVGRISLVLFLFMYQQKYIIWYFAALLVAGTLGNLFDRMILGGVRDFLYIGSRFPIFNMADVCLNAGIFGFLIKEMRLPKK